MTLPPDTGLYKMIYKNRFVTINPLQVCLLPAKIVQNSDSLVKHVIERIALFGFLESEYLFSRILILSGDH